MKGLFRRIIKRKKNVSTRKNAKKAFVTKSFLYKFLIKRKNYNNLEHPVK